MREVYRYQFELGEIDEDGMQVVIIHDNFAGRVLERYMIRCDMARQWAAQEVDCLEQYDVEAAERDGGG